jgi:hypothetical protein
MICIMHLPHGQLSANWLCKDVPIPWLHSITARRLELCMIIMYIMVNIFLIFFVSNAGPSNIQLNLRCFFRKQHWSLCYTT